MADHATGVAIAATGVGVCLLAVLLALWSYFRLRGANAGASLSAACLVLAVCGAAAGVAGAVIAHHG